jgi:hypothetical protein
MYIFPVTEPETLGCGGDRVKHEKNFKYDTWTKLKNTSTPLADRVKFI